MTIRGVGIEANNIGADTADTLSFGIVLGSVATLTSPNPRVILRSNTLW